MLNESLIQSQREAEKCAEKKVSAATLSRFHFDLNYINVTTVLKQLIMPLIFFYDMIIFYPAH